MEGGEECEPKRLAESRRRCRTALYDIGADYAN